MPVCLHVCLSLPANLPTCTFASYHLADVEWTCASCPLGGCSPPAYLAVWLVVCMAGLLLLCLLVSMSVFQPHNLFFSLASFLFYLLFEVVFFLSYQLSSFLHSFFPCFIGSFYSIFLSSFLLFFPTPFFPLSCTSIFPSVHRTLFLPVPVFSSPISCRLWHASNSLPAYQDNSAPTRSGAPHGV